MTTQKPSDEESQWRTGIPVRGVLQEHFDITIAVAVTTIALACIVIPYLNASGARVVTTLVFILSVPGYVFVAALFPHSNDLSNAERAALSFAFSIGLMALIGIGLNYTPWGIQLGPVVACALVLTFACSWISVKRRDALAKADRFTVRFADVRAAGNVTLPQSGAGLDRRLTLIAIASLVVSASVFAYLLATPTNEDATELYVLGPYGQARDYPQEFTLGQTRSVVVGVTNRENSEASYVLAVKLNDSGNATTLDTERIALGNGQTWQQNVSLTPDRIGDGMKMEFTLYKEPDLNTPYRDVYFWVNVTLA
ncbi:MAG: DUF1616 domain-containing protein [Halobacteriota archaeon]|jgi:uncharacterized membrane protein